jgi:hypothetical protein
MADLDLELIERVARWCAEAGRQTTPAGIEAALGGLGWDELLAVRALLADPPPARPLGPHALADLARGATVDQVVDREQAGRYPAAPPARPAKPSTAAAPADPPPQEKRPGKRAAKARLQVVVRKPVPPAAPAPPTPAALALLDELLLPPGRNALERLIRRHGGKRPALLGALAATHRRAEGGAVGDEDLDRLLQLHGLARAYQRRERDEVLHAVRAAGGVLSRAAVALGFDAPGLSAAVMRLGAVAEVEAVRAARRAELSARATLSERVQLVLGDADRLADLGLLEPFLEDLRARLPEHLRALRGTRGPLALALATSLSLPPGGVADLAARVGLDLSRPPAAAPPSAGAGGSSADPPSRSRDRAPPRGRPVRPGSTPRDRPAGARPSGARPADRPPRDRPPGDRPSGDRPSADRPSGDRPYRGRPSGGRPSGGRPSSDRPSGGRPAGDRASGGRSSGGRPFSDRPSSGRPPGDRPSSGRPPGDRPSSGRPPGARPTGGSSRGRPTGVPSPDTRRGPARPAGRSPSRAPRPSGRGPHRTP